MAFFLQKILGNIRHLLVNIFKVCITHKHVPIAWRAVSVVFMQKIDKSFYTSAKFFRAISFAFLLKTLEKLYDKFIRRFHFLSFITKSPRLQK